MNRIQHLFSNKTNHILSVYFTAGYPEPESTVRIIEALSGNGVDMIEIGIPFSDPLADGPIIQQSNSKALKQGMSLKLLFNQLRGIRLKTDIPLLLMGYLNPVLRYGMDQFCLSCAETGIDGVILPDLPPEVFCREYSDLFTDAGLFNIFLVSPLTPEHRIRMIDSISKGFIYLVAASSVTGVKDGFSASQLDYFARVRDMKLSHPALLGFGVSNHRSYSAACRYASGAIIGSAFIDMLDREGDSAESVGRFIRAVRHGE